MTVTITDMPAAIPSRALRLKASTRQVHEGIDHSIMRAASFATLEGYVRFLRIQYLFHRDIEALYADSRLLAVLPGLRERCRLPLVMADLSDLGIAFPDADAPVFTSDTSANIGYALGWLYVAEGSNLGAALLRKEAAKLALSDTFGARHLAPSGDGPTAHWRAFTAGLDAATLSGADEGHADEGALAAFGRVQAHIDAQLG